jgi:Arc/MetJ-type ribon-helix-helix transcriptional regulator
MEEITIMIPEKMKKRLDTKTESGDWTSRSSYVRDMIKAGESNIVKFDPRKDPDSNESKKIDKMILDGLDNNPKDIDKCLDPALNTLASRLDEMADDDEYQVERIPREGYKLD